jgi:6-phosphofructokinase 1
MAGWTGFTVGNVHDRACYIPLSEINAKRQIEQNDRAWQRLLASTGQPSFLNDVDYNAEDTA